MNATTDKTPAADTARGKRVQILIDEDMAETVARLAYFTRVMDIVNGSLKLEVAPVDTNPKAQGENNDDLS